MSLLDILVVSSLILWIILGVGVLVSIVLLVPRAVSALRQFDEIGEGLARRSDSILNRTDSLLETTQQIATSLVNDVEAVDRTVIRATESVDRMVQLAEERVSDINALLEVAQEEAEETFFSTAAFLRTLRGGRSRRKQRVAKRERRRLG
jgi:hypothetical protein